MKPFNPLKPPVYAQGHIDSKAKSIKPGFESNWALAHYVYGLSQKLPGAVWLLIIRDPKWACNSLSNFNNADWRGADVLETCNCYNETWAGILRQALLMKVKPYWMDFEKYVRGWYIEPLLSLFDIPLVEANKKKARNHLARKVRSSGNYNPVDVLLYPRRRQGSIFQIGRQITSVVRDQCPELTLNSMNQ
ncbi:unnamed protein product [marine sediment metagenome]|uniref:Sulfotransferase domain-containing protein n=1 Tax=marine sediment metagenome TaxID=412755 RepID=X0RUP3_9ZZZZ